MLTNKVVVVVLIEGMMPGERSLATSVTHRPRLGGKVRVRLKLVLYNTLKFVVSMYIRAHISGVKTKKNGTVFGGGAQIRETFQKSISSPSIIPLF